MLGWILRLSAWLLAFGLSASLVGAVVDHASGPIGPWQWLGSVGGRGGEPRAFAQGPTGDLAVGDDSGVSWWRGGMRERATLSLVRDLAFDREGVLWIASADGLYAWRSQDRPMPRRLRGGDASNRIQALSVAGSALVVATGAGAFWSSDGRIFQPLPVATDVAVSHVAVRPGSLDRGVSASRAAGARETQVWLYGQGRLFRVRGLEASSGLRVIDIRAMPLPRPDRELSITDFVIDPSGARIHLVYDDLIAWRPLDEQDASTSAKAWRIERPILPPGALIRRLGWAVGRIWIASDHGLLEADSLAGPFRRSASPVGTTDCVEIQASADGGALALCRSGLFAYPDRGERGGAVASTPAAPTLPPDPPLAEIRRRALRRAGLAAERSEGLWSRLRRRAWLPEVDLHFDTELDHNRNHNSDQSFSSGATHHLYDQDRDDDERYRASIQFGWDLGGVVYPLESVDLSRELRQVVSLRDDVSDEINQSYFERQTIRERLETPGAVEPEERIRLRWRARELDAGLDAWTGGWISLWRRDHGAAAEVAIAPTSFASSSDDPAPSMRFPGPENPADQGRHPGERNTER
jgi:hypothetical protein